MNGFSTRNKHRGFTLIEAMITLAIIGAAIALALVYQSNAESSSRILETSSAINDLATKIKTYHASAGTYNGLTTTRIKSLLLELPPLTWDGINIHDPWGLTMVTGNALGAAPSFTIILGVSIPLVASQTMTAEECVSLATKLANSADVVNVGTSTAIRGVNGLATGGKVYKAAGNVLSMANLTDAAGCGAATPTIALQYH